MGLEKISEIRKEKGITLEKLAEKSSIPLSTLKKISSGAINNPSFENVLAISKALECSLEEFMDSPIFSQITYKERQHIEKYRKLDEHGKDMVDTVTEMELTRFKKLDEKSPLHYGGKEDTEFGKIFEFNNGYVCMKNGIPPTQEDLDEVQRILQELKEGE